MSHNHFVNDSAIKAEKYKMEMVDQVKCDPTLPVGEEIRAINMKTARELGSHKEEFANAFFQFWFSAAVMY